MLKSVERYDRDREWQALERFATSDKPGSTLGLVYGRRRQGKTYLLQTLTEASRGFCFAALRQSSTQWHLVPPTILPQRGSIGSKR